MESIDEFFQIQSHYNQWISQIIQYRITHAAIECYDW